MTTPLNPGEAQSLRAHFDRVTSWERSEQEELIRIDRLARDTPAGPDHSEDTPLHEAARHRQAVSDRMAGWYSANPKPFPFETFAKIHAGIDLFFQPGFDYGLTPAQQYEHIRRELESLMGLAPEFVLEALKGGEAPQDVHAEMRRLGTLLGYAHAVVYADPGGSTSPAGHPEDPGDRRTVSSGPPGGITTPDGTQPVLLIELNRQGEQPRVRGKLKPPLTSARYNVIQTLIEAGDVGLTCDQLAIKSGQGGAVNVLKTLARSDPDWGAVIVLPGRPGVRYRVRVTDSDGG